MKDLVQCRKLEAKFRQLAVSDPTKRFIWLAEAEKWQHEAEAEIASHFEACNAVRTTGALFHSDGYDGMASAEGRV